MSAPGGDVEREPTIREQTAALGEALKAIADADPVSAPQAAAASVFQSWLSIAGPLSRRADCFADVAENFVATEHTNRDVYNLFSMLEMYVPPDELPAEPETPMGTFIDLPMA